MSKISINDAVQQHVERTEKTWEQDRDSTVGASEVFQCMRQIAYRKLGVITDAGEKPSRGAMRRGDLLEREWWLPAMRGYVKPPAELLYAGDDQRTLVDGYLSATPDGLLIGVERDALAHLGIPDVGGDCMLVECKSIDPRVPLSETKVEHRGQVICQLGVVRYATNHRPLFGVVSYIDASFIDSVKEWPVTYDERVYVAAKDRARQIMTAESPLDLAPEGKIAGGKECGYCAYAMQCARAISDAVPTSEAPPSPQDVEEFEFLIAEYEDAKHRSDSADEALRAAQEEIKKQLRVIGRRKIKGPGWSVTYYAVKGRDGWDSEKLQKMFDSTGTDPAIYRREGKPSDALRILLDG